MCVCVCARDCECVSVCVFDIFVLLALICFGVAYRSVSSTVYNDTVFIISNCLVKIDYRCT